MYNPQITVDRITTLRNEKSIPLNVLNEACKLNKNTIKTSATSKNGLSSAFLYDIANYLNCSTDYLLGRTDFPSLICQENNSGNIVNGSNGDNSPLTVQNDELSEMEKEISSLLSNMSYRERTELMCIIYQFVDEHKK